MEQNDKKILEDCFYLSEFERKQFIIDRKNFKPFNKYLMTHPDGYGWKYLYSEGNLEYYLVSMGPIAVAELVDEMVVYFEIIEGKVAKEIYDKHKK